MKTQSVPRFPIILRRLALVILAFPAAAFAQTLGISNQVQTYASLTNTTVTMTGKSELHITGSSSPISGCVINLNSTDAWFFMQNVQPSVVISSYLGQIRVNGSTAVNGSNVTVMQYAQGAVVIPEGPSFTPMTIYDGQYFTGHSEALSCYTAYDGLTSIAPLSGVRSFKLKRGYTATIGQINVGNDGATLPSRNYVAADGDLTVSVLPSNLDNQVQFIRIFPWRWVSKKGIAGDPGISLLNVQSWYDWNIDQNSSSNLEYVPIRAQRWWPSLGQNWQTIGANSVLGYNEPDSSSQANIAVGDALWSWPDLLETGLRLGSPATTDGGVSSWLIPFVTDAQSEGMRVDFVAVHYYQGHSASDPSGCATQLYNFLLNIWNNTHLPIWLTEWNNGANWTDSSYAAPTYAQQQACIQAMVNMLESTPFVERYQLYNWVEDTRSVVLSGTLTPAGIVYANTVSGLGYQQILPYAGVSSAARYALDGDLSDATASGNDAMAVGAPKFVTGKYGQAVSLDGTNDYLELPTGMGQSTTFSFTGWVKWNGGSNWQRIFDFGTDTSHYMFLTPLGATGLRFAINTGSGEQVIDYTNVPLPTGVWTHVGLVLNGATGKLYINGSAVATNTAMTYNPSQIGTRLNYIGKSQFASDPKFSGQLDDLRFFPAALTDAQVASAAASATAPPQFTASPIVLASATTALQFSGSVASYVSGGVGALTFSKLSGPSWLIVSPNGSLFGVPQLTDCGPNTATVQVTDASGGVSSAVVQISVSNAPGLVARYPFDGTASAAVAPGRGAADGVAYGTVSYGVGAVGSAVQLNGSSSYVALPSGIVSGSDFTVAAWVYLNSSSQWARIFDFGTGTSNYMFLTPQNGSNNTIRFALLAGGVEADINGTAGLPTGTWCHIAVTETKGVGTLYVNGAVVGSNSSMTVSAASLGITTNNYIGKSQYAADPYLNGSVDEFLIFNQALSAPQIAALASTSNYAPAFASNPVTAAAATAGQNYEQTVSGAASDVSPGGTLTYSKASGPQWLTVNTNGRISGVPSDADAGNDYFTIRATDQNQLAADTVLDISVTATSGLLSHYQFDGNTHDTVGGGSATLAGAAAYAASPFDGAITLDGSTNYLQLPGAPINSLTSFTLATRVRWGGGSMWQRIFDFGNNTTQYMFLSPSSGSGNLRFAITSSGNNSEQQLNAPSALTSGEWDNVAVTVAGSSGTLYLNGAPVATGTITLSPASFAPALNYLGKSQFSDPLFNGLIDDFRIYGRALSPAEVTSLANPPAPAAVPDSSFSAWAAGYAFPAGQSGAYSDPDGDGIPNIWEYLLGSNPLSPDKGIMPQMSTMSASALGLSGTKTYVTIQCRVRTPHLGVTIVADGASSPGGLALPSATSHAHLASTVTSGQYQILTYYYDVAVQDSPSGFIRLRAVMQ